jgi:hypothetical protein
MRPASKDGGFLPAKYSSWFIFAHDLSGFRAENKDPYIDLSQGARSNSTHATGGYYSSLPAQFVALNVTSADNVVSEIFRRFSNNNWQI